MLEKVEDGVAKIVEVEASKEKSDGEIVVPFDDEGLLAFSTVSCFCAFKFSLLVLAFSLVKSLFFCVSFLTFSSRLSIFLVCSLLYL